MAYLLCVIVGVAAGAMSGLVGIGGGIIVIPFLVYALGFSQAAAQGTTLAMLLPPIGLFAVMAYYKQGYVNMPVAMFICLGFLFGGYLGAKFAIGLSQVMLRKAFAATMIVIGSYMFIK
jgi:uncharacterized membrane protein YfcA